MDAYSQHFHKGSWLLDFMNPVKNVELLISSRIFLILSNEMILNALNC